MNGENTALDRVAVAKSVDAAADRIAAYVENTPLLHSSAFSERYGAEVYFKLENLQTTGSFKLRGAMNRLLTLSEEQRARGCVTASSGNHGAAVASAMQQLGTSGIIFVPEQTSATKVAKIRRYGGDVRLFGTDGLDTEQHARRFAEESGRVYLSPYNDPEVIAGQGSCGVEILRQLPAVDTVVVAVGGGGLIGGIGAVMKQKDRDIKVIGCQPAASAVMARSVAAGVLLELESEATLSDGTAGGIEADAVTFGLCQQVVDEFVLLSENDIALAMDAFERHEKHAVEGAAGVAIAALEKCNLRLAGRTIAVVVCGGNIASDDFSAAVAGVRSQ